MSAAATTAIAFALAAGLAAPAEATKIVTPGNTLNGVSLPNLSLLNGGYPANNTFYSAGDTAAVVAGLVTYYGGQPNGGQHRIDTNKVTKKARKFLKDRVKGMSKRQLKKTALVFDIDDTLLSNYNLQASAVPAFSLTSAQMSAPQQDESVLLPVIPQTRKILKWAQRRGINIHMITGRRPDESANTYRNLAAVGIAGKFKVHFRPTLNPGVTTEPAAGPAMPYKSAVRKRIERKNKQVILANFGDQFSDLRGGYAEIAYKIPNPMYMIP